MNSPRFVSIVRDFRGASLWLVSYKLGDSPEFHWSADKTRACKVDASSAFQIMSATSAYGVSAAGSMLAIDAKGNLLKAGVRQLASVSAERRATFDRTIAAAKVEAYNAWSRATRMLAPRS